MKEKLEPTPYYHKPPMRNQDYEIYYNKDDALDHIAENKHAYYEFYFLISGDVTYYIQEQEYNLKPGAIMLIAPSQYHHAVINIHSGQPYERYVLWLNPDYLKRLSSDKTDLFLPFQKTHATSAHLQLTRDMQITIHNLLELIFSGTHSQEFGMDLLTNSYVIELLVYIARVKLFQPNSDIPASSSANTGASPAVTGALAYINSHIYEEIRVQDITSQLFVSRSYLSRVFNEEMGLSIHQFIVKKKLFLAKQDLIGGSSMQEVCHKYSFGNYSSFFRAFKQEFGQSPRNILKSR
ncbi:MAG TPA: helix-turn-helix domain-containing protein [Candidatus Cottocaccamicrobium excrementipullorum]|nr:helix-turn-helix domain-containing protein [Candidatus Cottocaccamicrobium excrementipullorum]